MKAARLPAGAESATHKNRSVEVYYGTNRTRSAPCREIQAAPSGSCDPNSFYGGQDSAAGLEVGQLTVTFPPTHQKGKVERPLVILTIQIEKEDPEEHVIVARIEPVSDKARWAQTLRESGGKEAVLYVHGYNVTFDSAARQAAQIAYDLDFAGLPLLYSWPSQGTLTGYRTDERMVQTAEEPIDEFLRLVTVDAQITKLHVIVHSMGNRLVTELLRNRASQASSPQIEQLILAAPDIDSGDFETRFASVLPKLARRVTLYVSSHDRALEASATIHHGQPRAGHVAGGLLGLAGIDTIDASNVQTDFLSHSYYAEGKSVLADIFCVLVGTSPDLRAMLVSNGNTRGGPSWKVLGVAANNTPPRDPGICAPPAPPERSDGPKDGPTSPNPWKWGAPILAAIAAVFGFRRFRVRSAGKQ